MNEKNYCNDFSSVAAIVPAGGAGSITNGVPKVLEEIYPGRSVIGQVLASLSPLNLGQRVVVVNNFLFKEQIQNHLRQEKLGNHVDWALQHWRLGAAEAVGVGLEKLSDRIDTVLVIYGDMPLWRTETIRQLIASTRFHLNDAGMVFVRLTEKTPEQIMRFGRCLRDKHGYIVGVVEPGDPILEGVSSEVDCVNPSLYVFNRSWLTRNLSHIRARSKGDGFTPELHMPELIRIARDASDASIGITELELEDDSEALGINTLAQLEEARQVLRSRVIASQLQVF